MIIDLDFERLIADKGLDADRFIQLLIKDYEAEAVIPPRARRKAPRDYDKHLHNAPHLVKYFINKIKWYRRILFLI